MLNYFRKRESERDALRSAILESAWLGERSTVEVLLMIEFHLNYIARVLAGLLGLHIFWSVFKW
ncbi:hypothetical protein AGMMS49992_28840 [Clostridia bacterium]|nr:hypothetical protein AGMMS49992_28840 [Clostridia bacterium]